MREAGVAFPASLAVLLLHHIAQIWLGCALPRKSGKSSQQSDSSPIDPHAVDLSCDGTVELRGSADNAGAGADGSGLRALQPVATALFASSHIPPSALEQFARCRRCDDVLEIASPAVEPTPATRLLVASLVRRFGIEETRTERKNDRVDAQEECLIAVCTRDVALGQSLDVRLRSQGMWVEHHAAPASLEDSLSYRLPPQVILLDLRCDRFSPDALATALGAAWALAPVVGVVATTLPTIPMLRLAHSVCAIGLLLSPFSDVSVAGVVTRSLRVTAAWQASRSSDGGACIGNRVVIVSGDDAWVGSLVDGLQRWGLSVEGFPSVEALVRHGNLSEYQAFLYDARHDPTCGSSLLDGRFWRKDGSHLVVIGVLDGADASRAASWSDRVIFRPYTDPPALVALTLWSAMGLHRRG